MKVYFSVSDELFRQIKKEIEAQFRVTNGDLMKELRGFNRELQQKNEQLELREINTENGEAYIDLYVHTNPGQYRPGFFERALTETEKEEVFYRVKKFFIDKFNVSISRTSGVHDIHQRSSPIPEHPSLAGNNSPQQDSRNSVSPAMQTMLEMLASEGVDADAFLGAFTATYRSIPKTIPSVSFEQLFDGLRVGKNRDGSIQLRYSVSLDATVLSNRMYYLNAMFSRTVGTDAFQKEKMVVSLESGEVRSIDSYTLNIGELKRLFPSQPLQHAGSPSIKKNEPLQNRLGIFSLNNRPEMQKGGQQHAKISQPLDSIAPNLTAGRKSGQSRASVMPHLITGRNSREPRVNIAPHLITGEKSNESRVQLRDKSPYDMEETEIIGAKEARVSTTKKSILKKSNNNNSEVRNNNSEDRLSIDELVSRGAFITEIDDEKVVDLFNSSDAIKQRAIQRLEGLLKEQGIDWLYKVEQNQQGGIFIRELTEVEKEAAKSKRPMVRQGSGFSRRNVEMSEATARMKCQDFLVDIIGHVFMLGHLMPKQVAIGKINPDWLFEIPPVVEKRVSRNIDEINEQWANPSIGDGLQNKKTSKVGFAAEVPPDSEDPSNGNYRKSHPNRVGNIEGRQFFQSVAEYHKTKNASDLADPSASDQRPKPK